MSHLKPYIAYAGDASDGCCLVFARSVREARVPAWDHILGWVPDAEFTDLRVRWLKGPEHEHLLEHCREDGPHVVEETPYCRACLCWTLPLDEAGLCAACQEDCA